MSKTFKKLFFQEVIDKYIEHANGELFYPAILLAFRIFKKNKNLFKNDELQCALTGFATAPKGLPLQFCMFAIKHIEYALDLWLASACLHLSEPTHLNQGL